jgi:signal transduction histidine kinase
MSVVPGFRAVLLGLVAIAGCSDVDDRDVAVVRDARLLLTSSATPPPDDRPGWTSEALPDLWTAARRRIATEGWYRATIPLAVAPGTLWAVYLPRVNMNAGVWVNGQFLGDGGRFDGVVSRNWNRPLLFTVPAGLLHAGANAVDVRLRCNRTGPGILSTFRVGPAAILRPAWEWRTFAQVTLAQIIGGATVALGLLLGIVFWNRDPQHTHRWAALGVIVWSLCFADAFVRDPPLPSRVWEWMQALAVSGFVPCFVVAFHRALGVRRPLLETLLFAIPMVTVTAVALLAPLYLFLGMVIGGAMALATAIYLLLLVRRATASPDNALQWFFVPAAIVGVVLGAHDVTSTVTGHLPAGLLLSPYIPPLIILVAGANLLAYVVRALDQSERLNRELEQRVEEKHRELEHNYARLRELERGHAVAAERDRLMRDVHDGMGGQLVSTLALVESGGSTPEGVAEALRDAIDDLRLVIDSLEPVENDLLAVLATIRARLEPRLARHGLHFDWQVADLPPLPGFGPEGVLQALRIVQEAITNVIKHAHATTIRVRTGEEPDIDGTPGVFVEISDDGTGLRPPMTPGRGVANMRRRAERLGGRIGFASDAMGTTVRLWLPQNRPETSSRVGVGEQGSPPLDSADAVPRPAKPARQT